MLVERVGSAERTGEHSPIYQKRSGAKARATAWFPPRIDHATTRLHVSSRQALWVVANQHGLKYAWPPWSGARRASPPCCHLAPPPHEVLPKFWRMISSGVGPRTLDGSSQRPTGAETADPPQMCCSLFAHLLFGHSRSCCRAHSRSCCRARHLGSRE
eukprot:scaffold22447_cov29-Tisochrysis_lutea.AAC.1